MGSNTVKLRIEDKLLLLILLVEDAGMFGIFPIAIAQILTILLGSIIIVKRSKIVFNQKLIFLLVYMASITIINVFDGDSLSNFILFIIEIFVMYWYLSDLKDYRVLFEVVFRAAVILSVIGIIQEVSYIFGINFLTDMKVYGFPRENVYPTVGPFARVSSLYSEPASLCTILSMAFFIGLIKRSNKQSKSSFQMIIILVFALFTQSTLLYVTLASILVVYIFCVEKSSTKKVKVFSGGMLLVTILMYFYEESFLRILNKIGTIFTASSENSTDLSGFALVSNLKVAIEKIFDGYILGTGYNSHRLYYDSYISQLYDTVYMHLNYIDAGSMYIRILSEFGIVGIIYLGLGLIRRFLLAFKDKELFMMVCVIVLSLGFIRDGNYIRTLNLLLFEIVFIMNDSKFKVGGVKLGK